jgi:signal transduction histidine kinase
LAFVHDTLLRATFDFDAPLLFPWKPSNNHTIHAGTPEYTAFHYERSSPHYDAYVTIGSLATMHAGRSSATDDAKNYTALGTRYRLWLNSERAVLFDTKTFNVTTHLLPDHSTITSTSPIASFTTASGVFASIQPKGRLLGRVNFNAQRNGEYIVAYRKPSATHYTIACEGARIKLSETEREIELITGRPKSWGASPMGQSIHASWSGAHTTSRTGSVTRLANIPPGSHTITITSPDRGKPTIVYLSVTPTISETWWFRLGLLCGSLILLGGTIRYVILVRRNRQEAQARALMEERMRIGQDLHDALGADLVRINMISRYAPSQERTEEVSRVVRDASRTLRDIIWSVSDVQTLDGAIAVLAERVRTQCEEANLDASIVLPSNIPAMPLPPQQLRDMMLIMTEALTNALRHSRASQVRYEVAIDSRGVTLCIIDDGCGYDPEHRSGGMGRSSMASRAQRSNLEFREISSPGAGTTIQVHVNTNQQ